MSKSEHPLHALTEYLPENTFEAVAEYITKYKVHLTISRERKSVLGNYRNAYSNQNHRISVNGNLNKYSFLVTLLHELAHLLTFDKFGHCVQSHGREWKNEFGVLLADFIKRKVFPLDIESELLASLHNPGASSCAEEGLMRVLRKYDKQREGFMLVEEVPLNGIFKTQDGRQFIKRERVRKRFRCEEVGAKKVYLFSPVYEVELVGINDSKIKLSGAKIIDNYAKPPQKDGYILLDDLPTNAIFQIDDGRKFKKIEKLRTRIKCEEVATKSFFVFSSKYPVKPGR